MTTTLKYSLALIALSATVASADWMDDYNEILQTYATPTGVKYKQLKANASDMKKLDSITKDIGKAKLPKNKQEKLAFYINAYNAWMLDVAIEKYPGIGVLHGEKDYFDKKRIVVAGKKMSFNDLENGTIRVQYKEPRIHFAVNCASESCPPLLNEVYRAKTLDTQLDTVTTNFMNSKRAFQISGKTAKVSSLFDWYKKDFGNVISYINKYSKKDIPKKSKIAYLQYDWSFNDAK